MPPIADLFTALPPPWQATFQQQMLTFQQQVLAQLTEQNRRLLAGQGQGLPEGG